MQTPNQNHFFSYLSDLHCVLMVSWFELQLLVVEANHYVEENSKETKHGLERTSKARKKSRSYIFDEKMNQPGWHGTAHPCEKVAAFPRIWARYTRLAKMSRLRFKMDGKWKMENENSWNFTWNFNVKLNPKIIMKCDKFSHESSSWNFTMKFERNFGETLFLITW